MQRLRQALPFLLTLLLLTAVTCGTRLPPLPEAGQFAFTPPSGLYRHDLTVALRPARTEAPIVFTFGGTRPDAERGQRYRHPIRLRADAPRMVILRAWEAGDPAVHTAAYLMGEPPALPVLALAADPADLWDEAGILAGSGREITATLLLLAEGAQPPSALDAGLRVEEPMSAKPDFRLAFRQRYGESRPALPWFDAPDLIAQRLLLEGGGAGGATALVDELLVSRTAETMGLAVPATHPVLLFLDEEPWGLYLLRERIDRRYVATHWGVQTADLRFGGDGRAGDLEAWDAMRQALEDAEATSPAFYTEARRRLDLAGLIDAVLLTQALGKGRIAAVRERREGAIWQWIVNPAGQMEAEDEVLRLHRRLLQNPAYHAAFEARRCDLARTTLAPSALTAQRASIEAEVRGALREEWLRWPAPPCALADDPAAAWEAEQAAQEAALRERAARLQCEEAPSTTPAAPLSPFHPNDVVINEYWLADDGTPYASLGGRGIVGDWIELRTRRPHLDLRGWRLTDNDRKEATDEGSLILPDLPALTDLPQGTLILIIATENVTNSRTFPADDLSPADGRLLFYVGNGHLDRSRDPGFALDRHDEALVLLAPGPTAAFGDDVGIDFVAEGSRVTPRTFGVAEDGVRFEAPFSGLGRDDGAIFTGEGSNDDGRIDWIVDPPPRLSGDAEGLGAMNILTPGAPNERQGTPAAQREVVLLTFGASALLLMALLLRRGRSAA